MNEFLPFVVPFMVVAIAVVSMAEMIISGLWVPAYYRYAIPLFRKEYPLTTMPDLAAQIPLLEQKLKRTWGRPSIVFRALDGNDIAFRNNFGSRNAMSGLIRVEPNQRRMRISGHMYWSFFLSPLLLILVMMLSPLGGFFLLFLLAVFVIVFGRQRYQYGQIAAVIAETAVSAQPLSSDYSDSTLPQPDPIIEKPLETVTYEPEFDGYKPVKTQSGLNNTELILIVVLVALLMIGAVSAFLLF